MKFLKDETGQIDRDKLKDYLTTIIALALPLLIANQVAIMAKIPTEYSWIAAIIFGLISQYYSNQRNTNETA